MSARPITILTGTTDGKYALLRPSSAWRMSVIGNLLQSYAFQNFVRNILGCYFANIHSSSYVFSLTSMRFCQWGHPLIRGKGYPDNGSTARVARLCNRNKSRDFDIFVFTLSLFTFHAMKCELTLRFWGNCPSWNYSTQLASPWQSWQLHHPLHLLLTGKD